MVVTDGADKGHREMQGKDAEQDEEGSPSESHEVSTVSESNSEEGRETWFINGEHRKEDVHDLVREYENPGEVEEEQVARLCIFLSGEKDENDRGVT